MSMPRNQNQDDACSKKRSKKIVVPWSELNHDVLFLVMMQLGIVDFLAFGGVCKSWRSFALSNKNCYLRSKPPMSIDIDGNECHLVDNERKKFKSIRLRSADMKCVGSTCGYLIFARDKSCDLWLVNPITKHDLHFHALPFSLFPDRASVRAFLVFSTLISRWVFVVLSIYSERIWFCVMGDQEWSNVFSPFGIHDLLAFKGKIYVMSYAYQLWEVILYPTPRYILLQTNNLLKSVFACPIFASSGEHIYLLDLIDLFSWHPYKIHVLDFDKMKWVSREEKGEEYAFFLGGMRYFTAVIIQRESWTGLCSQYNTYASTDKNEKGMVFESNRWYFFNEFSDVNLLHERRL